MKEMERARETGQVSKWRNKCGRQEDASDKWKRVGGGGEWLNERDEQSKKDRLGIKMGKKVWKARGRLRQTY